MKPPIGMVPLAGSKKGGYYDPSTGQTRYDQKAKYNKVTPKGVAETQKAANAGEATRDPGDPAGSPRTAPRGHRRGEWPRGVRGWGAGRVVNWFRIADSGACRVVFTH